MSNISKLLDQVLSSSATKGFAGGLAGGMAANLLSKKTTKKLGKNALKLGGVAAVGALAYSAYKNYSNKQSAMADSSPIASSLSHSDIPEPQHFLPETGGTEISDELSLTLIRAMIASARADGQMDAAESQAIFEKIQSLGIDEETQSSLIDEMNRPVDMDSLIKSATSPEIAAEIYTASLLAVEVDDNAERGYLNMLAARLKLPIQLVMEIEKQVKEQKVFA